MGCDSAAGDVRGNGARGEALHAPAWKAQMNWWCFSGGFVVGLVVGVGVMFVWIAETIAPAIDRIERAEKRRIEYWVRRDDAARNDYRSEL